MRQLIRYVLSVAVAVLIGSSAVNAQAVKINVPFFLVGTPNIGAEMTVSRQLSVSVDGMWAPYKWKKTESVLRSMQLGAEVRYYLNPDYYQSNDLWDGFYVGPYVMGGNFNVGLLGDRAIAESKRREGWMLSAGVAVGYKMYLTQRLRLDFNIGVGYIYGQYDQYRIGGEYAQYEPDYPDKTFNTVLPTRAGVHLVYNIFR